MSENAVQTIVEAVTTGAASAMKSIASNAVKEGYGLLTRKMSTLFGTKRTSEVLHQMETQPEQAKPQLKQMLLEVDAKKLSDIAGAAKGFLDLIQPQLTQQYNHVSVAGDVQTLIQGHGAQVTINAGASTKRRTKAKPSRGSS